MYENISPIVVIGAGGYMGIPYVEKLLELGVEAERIIGVEPNNERRAQAEEFGIRTVCRLQECLPDAPKTAIVSVPSHLHRTVFDECAAMGIRNVFTEKPLVLKSLELDGLDRLGLNFYVGYLINFSSAVEKLTSFMAKEKVVCRQVISMWGKNWWAVDRPMGPDLEEEFVHPLATAMYLAGPKAIVANAEVSTSGLPYVRPDVFSSGREGSSTLNNDTSVGIIRIAVNGRVVPVSILSSFNFTAQRRTMDVVLSREGSDEPVYKATLEFDVKTKGSGIRFDDLLVIDARTERTVLEYADTPDKLLAQVKAAFDAFEGGESDKRLVGYEQACEIVRALD